MFDLPPCTDYIAEHYQVPVVLIQAIRQQEGGAVGQVVGPNRNGTFDLGPMQINTYWFDETNPKNLLGMGVSKEEVLNNECTNIAVGTWILRMNFDWLRDWRKAVAAYNAGSDLKLGEAYATKVFAKLEQLY